MKSGAVVNSNASDDGYTPMYVAARVGRIDVIKALVDFGADVNALNKDGFTPLHVAAQSGHLEVISALAEYGGDLHIPNNDGNTHSRCYELWSCECNPNTGQAWS